MTNQDKYLGKPVFFTRTRRLVKGIAGAFTGEVTNEVVTERGIIIAVKASGLIRKKVTFVVRFGENADEHIVLSISEVIFDTGYSVPDVS